MDYEVIIKSGGYENKTSSEFETLTDFIDEFSERLIFSYALPVITIVVGFLGLWFFSDNNWKDSLGISASLAFFVAIPIGFFLDYKNQTVAKSIKEFYTSLKNPPSLKYSMPEEIAEAFNNISKSYNTEELIEIISETVSKDVKYTSGASSSVSTEPASYSESQIDGINSEINFPSIKLSDCTVYFMPDKVRIKFGDGFEEYEYKDVSVSIHRTKFTSSFPIASDANLVGETWQYVNKKGGKDQRFKDNPKRAITIQGVMNLKVGDEKFDIHFSNDHNHVDFANAIFAYRNKLTTLENEKDVVPNKESVIAFTAFAMFMSGIDGEFSDEEKNKIFNFITKHHNSSSKEITDQAISKAKELKNMLEGGSIDGIVEYLSQLTVSNAERELLMKFLLEVAESDGVVDDAEDKLLGLAWHAVK
ncbi:hypothetical protein PALB_6810 [Pseudoalteromonas luteoviolacea B = ATCC 29581]|nr:hypothetical protein PALB_6810 [Pseudoalteromonas luteoviolacea B = ATCC 29581]